MKIVTEQLKINNVNPNPEFHGEEKVDATDMSLKGTLTSDQFKQFFREDESWEHFEKFAWGNEGDQKTVDIGKFALNYKHDECRVTFEAGGKSHSLQVKLSKIKGTVELSKTADVEFHLKGYPSGDQREDLIAWTFEEGVKITLEAGDLFD